MNSILRDRLTAWEKRLRLQLAVRAAVIGTFVGAGFAAVYVLTAKWFHWPHAWETAAGVFGIVPSVAFVVSMMRKIPLADVARAADRAAGTSDRFATALELEGTEWAELVERDAAAAPLPREKDLFRTRLPKLSRWSFAAAALIAAMVFFIPARNLPAVPAIPTDMNGLQAPPELQAAAEDLRKLGAEEGDLKLAELGKELERIDKEWKDGKLDRKEALAEIGEVKEKIRQEKEKAAARKEALAKMAENEASHDLAHRTSTGEGAEAAADAAGKLGKSAADDGKLADALERAAKAAEQDKELAEALKKAADAARRGDKKAFEEAMKTARERWNGLSKKGAEMQKREQAARKAEQAAAAKGKQGKKLDPALMKELEALLKKNGLSDKELQDALDKLAKMAGEKGADGETAEMDDEKLKEMIEKMKSLDPNAAKELAEKLKKMSPKELEALAKEMQSKCAGGS